MTGAAIAEVVGSLTPQEQETVIAFIAFLRENRETAASPFLAAADEFMDQHPELLQRLAQ